MKYSVNIDLANETKKEMAEHLNKNDKRILNEPGAFACLFDADLKRYEHPVLVLKTEEPGSKQLIAMKYDRIEGVCHDMINHLVNDCIVTGATPLTVQDAIICGKLDKSLVKRIVAAISEACAENGCVLTGGETSEQPNVIGDNTYILTSSILGIVEKKHIVDGKSIVEGDIVLGVASSGIHTNGYTLVRTIMEKRPEIMDQLVAGRSFLDAVLEPHVCYYNVLKDLFGKNILKGMAHITGGGIRENLNRILPSGVNAAIDLGAYEVPEIFKILRMFGSVGDADMLRTFNLGVGMAIVVSPGNAGAVLTHIRSRGVGAREIGVIVKGRGEVQCAGELRWN